MIGNSKVNFFKVSYGFLATVLLNNTPYEKIHIVKSQNFTV